MGGSSPAASVGKGGTAGREALHMGTSDFRGLVVLEEHLPTSHLLSEGPGSEVRGNAACAGTYMEVGT